MKLNVTILMLVVLVPIAGAQQPKPQLCIVDGVRFPGINCANVFAGPGMANLDIARVEVIKGPAAITQYGGEGANGVVIITTNKKERPAMPPDGDPLAGSFFPPELVMAHQQEVGLSETQRLFIQVAMKTTQAKFVDLQFQMSGEVEKLQHLVQSTSVDEAKTLEQVDRVLAVEREIKHAQLALMIKIKNQLTEQQQAALAKLR